MKIRTNYTFNSNSFSLLSCFCNDLECCMCARWDSYANGLMVLYICASLEEALVAKNAFCWQQCFFFTHVFLYIV